MMGWLKNDWSSSAQYPMLQMQAEMAKHTAIGNHYIDGTVVTPEGKQVKLSSLIKKGGVLGFLVSSMSSGDSTSQEGTREIQGFQHHQYFR